MPNSLLWIGLVVLWIFVLFPMLADRHPRIRQTTDAALATRVLHRGGSKRKVQRGPAAGHESDPDWQPKRQPARASAMRTGESDDIAQPGTVTTDHIHAEDPMDTEIDTETDESEKAESQAPADAPAAKGRPTDETAEEQRAAEYVPVRRGRGGFDPQADAIARAARYTFRQRAVLGLVLLAVLTAALGMAISSLMWWVCGLTVAGLGAYLGYLRRQVRMEEEIRRRRMARLGRSRLGVESRTDEELRLVPTRLRRPGAVVLEVDDEDPAFEHLEHYDAARASDAEPHARMPRAAGQ